MPTAPLDLSPRSIVSSRGVQYGVLAGLVGMLLFLVAHAILITPIWLRGLPGGLAVAGIGGGVAGWVYGRVREDLPGPPAYRGAVFGGVVALTLVPALFVSAARVGQSPLWLVLAVLALSLAAVLVGILALLASTPTPWAGEDLSRFLWVVVPAFLLNAYPGLFLVFGVPALDVGYVPNPWPQTIALGLVYVACGAIVERLLSLDDAPVPAPAKA